MYSDKFDVILNSKQMFISFLVSCGFAVTVLHLQVQFEVLEIRNPSALMFVRAWPITMSMTNLEINMCHNLITLELALPGYILIQVLNQFSVLYNNRSSLTDN